MTDKQKIEAMTLLLGINNNVTSAKKKPSKREIASAEVHKQRIFYKAKKNLC